MNQKHPVIFITGATSGLGMEAALHAAGNGAKILALYRNESKLNQLLQTLKERYPDTDGSILGIPGDLNDFHSVEKACWFLSENYPMLNQVILNAGTWNFKHLLSADGIEQTLQTNVIMSLYLAEMLLPQVERAEGKIIFTASALHQGKIQWEDPEFKQSFSGFKAYRQSKLGIILLTRLLASAWSNKKVFVACQHPGLVNTELGRSAGGFSRWFFKTMGMSPRKGAETLIWLMDTPADQLKAGEYYARKSIKKTTTYSYNLEEANKLKALCSDYIQRMKK